MSILLALSGLAGLVGAATILIWLARRRANVWGAFLLGLVIVVVVFMLMAPSLEASLGATNEGLVIGMVITLGAALAAAALVMNMVFSAKGAPERGNARRPGGGDGARPAREAPRGPVADV